MHGPALLGMRQRSGSAMLLSLGPDAKNQALRASSPNRAFQLIILYSRPRGSDGSPSPRLGIGEMASRSYIRHLTSLAYDCDTRHLVADDSRVSAPRAFRLQTEFRLRWVSRLIRRIGRNLWSPEDQEALRHRMPRSGAIVSRFSNIRPTRLAVGSRGAPLFRHGQSARSRVGS